MAEITLEGLKDLTLEELKKVENPVLKEALLRSKEQASKDISGSYIKHNQHESHLNTA